MKKNRRLDSLRVAMKERGINIYFIPLGDPHMGEYISDHWQTVKWLTGFSGSAATLIVTRTFAGLWTDSRYFLQCADQLQGSGFELMKLGSETAKTPVEWLAENMARKGTIGFDGRIMPLRTFRTMKEKLSSRVVLFDTKCDLISGIWENRPALPDNTVYNYPAEYAGEDRMSKIDAVRKKLEARRATHQLLTSPDEIMWLLNIRGSDVRFSPLLLSFAIVTPDQVLLFAHEGKIPFKLASEFDRQGIVVLPYDEVDSILSSLPAGTSMLLDPAITSVSLMDSINPAVSIIEDISIPARLKARKNNTEISCARSIMVRDGVALVKFFFWIDKAIVSGNLNEVSAAEKLLELRLQQSNFISESFPAIVAFNEHSAMPHYAPGRNNPAIIVENGVLLVDSGGQYLGGTTDITRTISTGKTTPEMRRDFTLALKGMIILASAVFPEGTRGYQLDILARKALWDNHMNYGHGTGHGVGSFLNVHEGPQSVSATGVTNSSVSLEPGMIISDEPAIYREGKYGFRTENLLLVVPDRISEYGSFLRFETLSLCYIDLTLIEPGLLDEREIEWLNNYQSVVYEKLSPYLSNYEREWLRLKTRELKR